jgi:ribosomal protein S27AE
MFAERTVAPGLPPGLVHNEIALTQPEESTMKQRCPNCGASARVVRNPFFGTGLAVHEYLIDCEECDSTSFKPNSAARSDDDAPVRSPRFAARMLQGMLNRLER